MLAIILAALGQVDVLTYTDRSAAFLTPAWEGGRSVLRLADINLDGHPDMLTVGDHGSPLFASGLGGISIWLGKGDGTFTFTQTGDFGYGGIDVGDVNNDGFPDVAFGVHHNWSATDFGDQVLEVALGDGTGKAWMPWDDNLGMQGQSWGMFGCALADFNADGRLDLASNAFGCCDGIHAYMNDGDGSWTPTLTKLNGNSDMDIQACDIDNDGDADFITSSQNGTVWLGNGAGGFVGGDAGLPAGGILGRVGASAGDFDRDGRDDLAFCPVAGVAVYRSTVGGWAKMSAGLPTTGTYARTLLADMDNDGRLDVVAFRSGSLEIYLGDGAGNWTPDAVLAVPSPGTFSALAVGDVDHNGRPDIALLARKQTGTFSSKNFLYFWTEGTPATKSTVRITSPPPGRVWRAGAAVFIEWQASSRRQTFLLPMTLWASTAGPLGPWTKVATGISGGGRFQLIVDPAWAGSEMHFKVTAGSVPFVEGGVAGPVVVVP